MPQNLTASLAELSDASLVNLVRDGNDTAYSVLWERHRQAAHTAARGISSHDPEDMAQEAFVRILQAIRNGAGPTEGFRPYLYTTLRTISMAWSAKDPSMFSLDEQIDSLGDGADLQDDSADRGLTVRAFTALPKEWRTVLWYTEVEGMTPAEVAPILGMTAGAVAALSFRARNGLRESWLQTHSAAVSPDTPDNCRWAQEHFASYLRDSISARRAERLQNHLVDCFPCSASFAELSEVNGSLRGLLLPLFLGVPAAALYQSGLLLVPTLGAAVISPTVPLAPFPAALQWIEANKPAAIGTTVGVVAVAAVGIAFAVTASSGLEPPAEPVASQSVVASQPPPAGSSGQSGIVATSPSPETKDPEAVQDEEPEDALTPLPSSTRDSTNGPTVPAPVNPSPAPSNGLAIPDFVEPTRPPAAVEPNTDPSGPGVPTPEPAEVPSDTVDPSNPDLSPPKATQSPSATVPPTADLSMEPVVHIEQFMPQIVGTGEPGAMVQVLENNKTLHQELVPESGNWAIDVPSVEIEAAVTTLQFEVRQSITNAAGEVTVSSSVPVLNTDGSADFVVQAPVWSHISRNSNTTSGNADAVKSGGTIAVSPSSTTSQNNAVYLHFAGVQGSDISISINGTSSGTLHTGQGSALLTRFWAEKWGLSNVGPQRIELSYSDGKRRGPHVAFEFNLEVQ